MIVHNKKLKFKNSIMNYWTLCFQSESLEKKYLKASFSMISQVFSLLLNCIGVLVSIILISMKITKHNQGDRTDLIIMGVISSVNGIIIFITGALLYRLRKIKDINTRASLHRVIPVLQLTIILIWHYWLLYFYVYNFHISQTNTNSNVSDSGEDNADGTETISMSDTIFGLFIFYDIQVYWIIFFLWIMHLSYYITFILTVALFIITLILVISRHHIKDIIVKYIILTLITPLLMCLLNYIIERKKRMQFYLSSKVEEHTDVFSDIIKTKKMFWTVFKFNTRDDTEDWYINSNFKKSLRKKYFNNLKRIPITKEYVAFVKKVFFNHLCSVNESLPTELKEILKPLKTESDADEDTKAQSIDNWFHYFNRAIFPNIPNDKISTIPDFNWSAQSSNCLSVQTHENILWKDVPEYLKNDIIYIGEKHSDKDKNKKFSVFIHANREKGFWICSSFLSANVNFLAPRENKQNQMKKIAWLTSKITHEIKNPLFAIQNELNSLKSMLMSSYNLNISEIISPIINYSEYLLIITKDFEYIAKETQNINTINYTSAIEAKPFELGTALNFCINWIKKVKRKNNVSIELNIDNDIQKIILNTDEIRLKQVIINILSNSMKFTKYGRIDLKCRDIDDKYWSIEIKDTGYGMKEEEVKMWNKDDESDQRGWFMKSTVDNEMGSGLGWSIIKSWIKVLGKDFRLESDFGKGTTISFSILKNYGNAKPCTTWPSINNSPTMKNIKSLNNASKGDTIPSQCIKQDVNPSGNAHNSNGNDTCNNNNNSITNNQININMNASPCYDNENNQDTKRCDHIIVKPQLDSFQASSNTQNIMDRWKSYFEISVQQNIAQKVPISRTKSVISRHYLHAISEEICAENKNIILDESNKIRIWVVEDEITIRKSQVHWLNTYCKINNFDAVIEDCEDGFECLYKIYRGFSLNKKYSFIITDDSMKFWNGCYMGSIIKTLIHEKVIYKMKLFWASANFSNEEGKELYSCFDAMYTKPISNSNLEEIFNIINT